MQSLQASQAHVISVLEGLGGKILYTYQIVYNGIAVIIDSGRLQSFDHISVLSVKQVHYYLPSLDSSVPFVFDGKTNDDLGVDGTGITIAVIDTGIDYTHAAFGGSGDPTEYAANDPTTLADGGFPSTKVIGGTDLVGENYDAWKHHHGRNYDVGDASELEMENNGIRGTIVDVYQHGVWDAPEDLIDEAPGMPYTPDNWFDIRNTGAKTYFVGWGNILEFAMATWGARTAANVMETDVLIDADQDGFWDYVVVAVDYFEDGTIISAVFSAAGGGLLEFYLSNDAGTSLQTIPVVLEDINYLGSVFGLPLIDGDNPEFDYWVETYDLESGGFDESGVASFNVMTPTTVSLDYFYIEVGEELVLSVSASEDSALLFLYMNNRSGSSQAQVFNVRV